MLGKCRVFLRQKIFSIFSFVAGLFFQDHQLTQISEKVQFIIHQIYTELFKYWSRHLHQHLSKKHPNIMKSPEVKGYRSTEVLVF